MVGMEDLPMKNMAAMVAKSVKNTWEKPVNMPLAVYLTITIFGYKNLNEH